MAPAPRSLRLAVVDPLTLKGKELSRALAASALSVAGVQLLGSGEAAGTLSEFLGEATLVGRLEPETLDPADVVIGCGAGEGIAAAWPWLRERDLAVIDLGAGVPLGAGVRILPGGGAAELAPGLLLRAPHPVTVLVGAVLSALGESVPLLGVEAMALEPVVGYGRAGIDELHEQTRELLSFRPAPTAVLGERIAFNAVPLAGAAARALEARLRDELLAILGSEMPRVRLSFVRVPVFLGLGLLLSLELGDEGDAGLVPELLADAPGLRLHDPPATPGDLPDDDENDTAWVSVLGGSDPGRVRIWAVADPIRSEVGQVVAYLSRAVR